MLLFLPITSHLNQQSCFHKPLGMLGYFFHQRVFFNRAWGQEPPGPCQHLSEAGRSVLAGMGTRAEWSFQILVFLGLWERPLSFLVIVFHGQSLLVQDGRGSQLPQSPRRRWAKWMQQNPFSDPSSHSTERVQISPPPPRKQAHDLELRVQAGPGVQRK